MFNVASVLPPCCKSTNRKGALTPSPSSLAKTLITCPSDFNGSVISDKPIKSIS